MSEFALSVSFEYLCYWSAAIMNILILSMRGPSLVRITVFIRQNLTSMQTSDSDVIKMVPALKELGLLKLGIAEAMPSSK